MVDEGTELRFQLNVSPTQKIPDRVEKKSREHVYRASVWEYKTGHVTKVENFYESLVSHETRFTIYYALDNVVL